MVFPLGDNERTRIVPVATYTLIALNVMAFFVQMERGEAFTTAYAATPYEISHNFDIPEPVVLPVERSAASVLRPVREAVVIPQRAVPFPVWFTLFTSMFLHGGLMHLAGNMLYLWIFGDNVEEVLGSVRFVIVYVCCGLAASIAQILANTESMIPTLGASGAIAGVMGAYLIWFPRNRVRVLFLYNVIEVPALLMIGLWIGAQFWQSLGSFGRPETGGVAYLAHVAGAACGVFVGYLFREIARSQGHRTWFDPPPTGVRGR
jgi:membrane associated rhomboid family serine protease